MILTPQRLEILIKVEMIAQKSEFKLAPITKLIESFDRTPIATRMIVSGLKKEGLLEAPVWGSYRLTPVGKQILKELRESG